MGRAIALPIPGGSMDLGTLVGMMADFGMIEIIEIGLVISAFLFVAMRFLDIGRY